MDPITGDIVWLYEDGTWAMTEPAGPLANKTKRWAQTMAQKITSTRERAHERAQALKKELDAEAAASAKVEPEVPATPPEDIPF